MKYILDFDRTLFDTDTWLAAAMKCGRTFAECITPAIWQEYQVRDFLYPDVLPWLQSKPKADVHILTAIAPEFGPRAAEFQKEKLRSSKLNEWVADITYVIGDKGSYVKDLANGEVTVFVDDKLSHHLSVKVHAPAVTTVLIHRPGATIEPTDQPGIITVHDLSELDQYLQ